jgi:hypothetical protein
MPDSRAGKAISSHYTRVEECVKDTKKGKEKEIVLESLPPWPFFAGSEFRSRSASLAMVRGSWDILSWKLVNCGWVPE